MKIIICDYCGSEVKERKEKKLKHKLKNQTVKLKTKYKINWVDTYVTDSNFANRQRCVAIPKGEKKSIAFKSVF